MLIISKFKDFYDSGSAYGIDKKKVFKRVGGDDTFSATHIHHEELINFNIESRFGFRNNDVISFQSLYFCGKVYSYYKIINVRGKSKNYNSAAFNSIDKSYIYCYTEEDLKENKNIVDAAYHYWKNEAKYFYFIGQDDFRVDKIAKKLSYMQDFIKRNLIKDLDNYSKEKNVPYFIFKLKYCPYKSQNNLQVDVEKNPILKEIKFGKILSPFETFGQVEQHLFAYLDNDPEMVEISDKDKAIARGHGGKYSFKKPPENKKG